MILIKPVAQEGIPHCLSSKVPSPRSRFPLRPSRSVIPHLDVTPSPRPGLLQDIPLSSALASPPARKESLQKVPVCQGGGFPGIMNTPGSCRGAQNAWCHQGWSPSLHSPLEKKFILAKAVLLDLAWSCAPDLGLCTCLFLVPFVRFGFRAVFLFLRCQEFLYPCLIVVSCKMFVKPLHQAL